MMRHLVFLCSALAFLASPTSQSETLEPEWLAQHLKSYVEGVLSDEQIGANDEFSVTVSNLDPRLKLEACEHTPLKKITSPRPYGTNLSIKVTCKSPKPWSLYVPAKVDQVADVAVLAHSLRRGTVISANDVTLERVNVAKAGYGYIRDPNRVIGMELKKPMQAGETFRISHLKQPQLVKRGDKVTLEASNSTISVVTTGEALSSGKKGEQIRVRNKKSERVVDAIVIAPGRVKVGGW